MFNLIYFMKEIICLFAKRKDNIYVPRCESLTLRVLRHLLCAMCRVSIFLLTASDFRTRFIFVLFRWRIFSTQASCVSHISSVIHLVACMNIVIYCFFRAWMNFASEAETNDSLRSWL